MDPTLRAAVHQPAEGQISEHSCRADKASQLDLWPYPRVRRVGLHQRLRSRLQPQARGFRSCCKRTDGSHHYILRIGTNAPSKDAELSAELCGDKTGSMMHRDSTTR